MWQKESRDCKTIHYKVDIMSIKQKSSIELMNMYAEILAEFNAFAIAYPELAKE